MNIIELAKQAEFTDREIQITHDNFVRFAALVAAQEREAAITAIQNIERKGGWVTREDAINAIKARETNMTGYQSKKAAAQAKTIDEVNWADHEPNGLAQPEQEPDRFCDANCTWSDHHPDCKYGTQAPLQRTWVDVPDEEIKILWIQYRAALPRYLCFAKALLARTKEDNK